MTTRSMLTKNIFVRVSRFFAAGAVLLATAARGQLTASVSSVVERVREAAQILDRHRQVTDANESTDAILRAWLNMLDPLAAYWTAEEAEAWKETENGAVFEAGIRLAVSNEAIVIQEIEPSSHAAEAGLQPGCRLQAIDHAPTAGEPLERVQSWLQLVTNRPQILTVADLAGTEREVSVTPTPGRKSAVGQAETLPTGIGYLKLNGFYPRSEAGILSTIRRWVGDPECYGIVLDLRGASGRDAEAAAAVASVFAAEGRNLAAFRDANGTELQAFVAGTAFPITTPVMILTDSDTRGAAEWFAAVVKGLGRGAMLIGSSTRGDPLVREPVSLSWGRVMYIVTRRLVTADGSVYDGRGGVTPHIVVSPPSEMPYEPPTTPDAVAKMSEEEKEDRRLRLRIGADSVLRRAVELLQGLRALNVEP